MILLKGTPIYHLVRVRVNERILFVDFLFNDSASLIRTYKTPVSVTDDIKHFLLNLSI